MTQKKKSKKSISLSTLEKKYRKAYSNPKYNEYENFNEFVNSYEDSGFEITGR